VQQTSVAKVLPLKSVAISGERKAVSARVELGWVDTISTNAGAVDTTPQ
jgi:hypothetical protein